jgi:hypothetical protein
MPGDPWLGGARRDKDADPAATHHAKPRREGAIDFPRAMITDRKVAPTEARGHLAASQTAKSGAEVTARELDRDFPRR